MADAVVVGSGPNGLTAAVLLARAGVRVTVLEAADTIGGGARSGELTLPGLVHDHCSAVLPLAVGSPVLRELGLERHGLIWCHPEIPLAHPLDTHVPDRAGGAAAVLTRSLADTAAGLAADAARWRALFGAPSRRFDDLADDILRGTLRVPHHPLLLARFGMPALMPAASLARLFRSEPARALFAGMAAHAVRPLTSPTTAAIGLVLGASGQHDGWPVARGGSGAVTSALAADLLAHGGRIETGREVTRLEEVEPADLVLLDLSPRGALRVAGHRLPARVRRAYSRYRYGPAAFKVDFAVQGGIPWRAEACRRAGTVHVGGTLPEITRAEAEVHAGRMPEDPFVLVAQQYLADPSRSAGDLHPIWAYAHVPRGWPGDATGHVIGQIERFAPGFRDRVVAVASRSPAESEAYDANYVGGDISTGANDPVQTLFRPRVAVDPWSTGIPGVYLCSAATPPGGGVHGMCGSNAAEAALRELRRR